MAGSVWVVSIEWNDPPSEVTGDPGTVGVYASEAGANAAAQKERDDFHKAGKTVYGYSQCQYAYCAWCGEECERDAAGVPKECPCEKANDPGSEEFCHHCGAELTDSKSCNNDHDEWDLDIHTREHEVQP